MSDSNHTLGRDPLEVQFADMRRQLEGYIQAFDCINEAMGFAHRAISDPDSIAVVDLPTETKDANARLIAAAPELLEALKALRDKVGSCICYAESRELTYERWPKPPLLRRKRTRIDLIDLWAMAEAAIAKAKGEQP